MANATADAAPKETAESRCVRALRRLEMMLEKAERAHQRAEDDARRANETVIATRATLIALREARNSTAEGLAKEVAHG